MQFVDSPTISVIQLNKVDRRVGITHTELKAESITTHNDAILDCDCRSIYLSVDLEYT